MTRGAGVTRGTGVRRGFRLGRPEEGWLAIALVAALGLILAEAVDDPGWVQGKGALTDGLPLCALLGFAAGLAGPKLGWGRWTTHLVGALFAALLIPILSAWALHPGISVPDAFRAAASGSVDAYLDLAWRARRFTTQEVHYILVLGGVVWGTMQFAAYAVFGHRRPLNAILIVGLILLVNMALTSRDQLPFLVLFAAVALFLLVSMHVLDERETWTRRRIGDPGAISGLYLRGGTVFILIAMFGSLALTQKASSSPLANAWGPVDQQLIGVGQAIGRLFPVGGDVRGTGSVTFGQAARISGRWFSNDAVAFTATVPQGTPESLKWRAATYDSFQLDGWVQTDTVSVPVQAGDSLLDGMSESSPADLVTPVSVRVQPQGYREAMALSPGLAISVDEDTTLLTAGPNGSLAGVQLSSADSAYGVEADALRLADQDAVTGNRLRVAGTDYPLDVTLRYTTIPGGAIGPDATALLAAMKASAKGTDPYSLAVAMVAYLRDDSRFTYSTDVRAVVCDTASAVECFARTRTGYCLHYASTMAILLRAAYPDSPIPTRLVQGFLPGRRNGTTESVTNRSAHAWVEVYFPGYGWIPFDPTGGGVGQASVIVDGPPVASPSPTPSGLKPSVQPQPSRRTQADPGGDASATAAGAGGGPGNRALAIVLALLVALAVAGLALSAWLRGPRGELSPDGAWRTMSRVASRLGFAPRPTETVYEYATSLGALVPVARADLDTVAVAKVETAYAGARLGVERLAAVREATRRLRVSLLRLVLRRRFRKLR